MIPSQYQVSIYKAIRLAKQRRDKDQKSNFVVNAVAGSGKSTTARGGINTYLEKFPHHRVLLIAFNRHIVQEMKEKIGDNPNIDVITSHTAGLRVLKANGYSFNKFQIKGGKTYYISKDLVEKEHRAEFIAAYKVEEGGVDSGGKVKKVLKKAASQLTELASKVMVTMTDYNDYNSLMDLVEKFELDVNPICFKYVSKVIEIGLEAVRNRKMISFDEMIYAPVVFKCVFPRYDLVLVDELQDLNKSQLRLVRRFSKNAIVGGFGDEFQAIQGFAGAMSDSMRQFEDLFDTRDYPLSTCYRCDSAILDIARILVPHIRDRDNCDSGLTETIDIWDVARKAMPGDFIACRITAPLVSCCIGFLKIGKPAKVKGRDISYKILDHIQACIDINPDIRTVNDFLEAFEEYKANEIARGIAKKMKEGSMGLLVDELDSVSAIAEYVYEKNQYADCNLISKHVKEMFDDEITTKFVLLSSIHRLKGLEADRVFILEPDKLPFCWKGQMPSGEKMQQELNLIYVAVTRAKKELFIVKDQKIRTINDFTDKLLSLRSAHYGDNVDELDPSDRIGAFRND
jgi:DNA helicase-2/ATP-dependent DNA helicase PcrA